MDNAAATDPAELFAHGNTLLAQGDAKAAVDAFRRCLVVAPNHPATCFNLGNALNKAGQPLDAVDAFIACLRAAPDFGLAYISLATTLQSLTLLAQAQTMAERAVQLLPAEPEATLCLASVLHDRADHAGAAALYRQALVCVPEHAGGWSSLGNALRAIGQLEAARAAHDRAVALAPENANARFARAVSLLSTGDFAAGWEDYEWRWRQAQSRGRDFGEAWQGEDIAGRTILLHAEQGLGDTLQFVRYVPMVLAQGASVVLEVQPSLLRLVQAMPSLTATSDSARHVRVVARGDPLPGFDVHCPLLSLPRAFATRLNTIPAMVPYLWADPIAAAACQARLPARPGLRVGLVWAGSPHSDNAGAHLIDRLRSTTLATLAPLGGIDGVRLISLQKDPDKTGLAKARAAGLTLFDPMPEVVDFADTAAVVANLDLVIAVDTSTAHLAGGLGRPVWLLLRHDGCWRWLNERTDSPWYPNMRIYRQDRPLDWSGVVARVRADLVALVGKTDVAGGDPVA